MNKELEDMRNRLKDMAANKSVRLYKLARLAEKHKCSSRLISSIKEEAAQMNTMKSYPERMLMLERTCKFRYALK